MKCILYSFPFLFLTMLAQAQQSVSYISFFPPANIVQNEVFLKQNIDSFYHADAVSGFAEREGEMHGSLILGAADNAHINIKTMTVISTSTSGTKSVENFYADNFIKIISQGTNKGIVNNFITIGNPSCAGSNCNKVFISSGKIKSVFNNIPYNSDKNIDVYVSDLASVKNISILKTTSTGSNFMASIPGDYQLLWCNLRLPGTEVCRKYLVALPNNSGQDVISGCRGTSFCRVPVED